MKTLDEISKFMFDKSGYDVKIARINTNTTISNQSFILSISKEYSIMLFTNTETRYLRPCLDILFPNCNRLYDFYICLNLTDEQKVEFMLLYFS